MAKKTDSSRFSINNLRIVASNITEAIDNVVMWICAIFLLLMTADILLGVFFRYVLQASIIWTEELARYMMIWTASLAMSSGIKRGEHLTIRFIVDALPLKLGYLIDIFLRTLLSGFLLVLIMYGIELVKTNMVFTSQALNLNMAIPTSSVPIAGMLMLIQLILATFLRLTSGKVAEVRS